MRRPFEYDQHEVIGMLVIITVSMFANAGGLGAGAVMIPVYMVLYGFSATDSIPLSKVTILAGAIVNFLLSWKTRHHKNPNRFLINYNQAAVIIPLLLAGTQIGVILSKLFPPVVIIGGLVYFLIKTSFQMYHRATKEWKKEQDMRREILGRSAVTKGQDVEMKNSTKLGSQILEDDKVTRSESTNGPDKSTDTDQSEPDRSSQSKALDEESSQQRHEPAEIGDSKGTQDEFNQMNKSVEEHVSTIVLFNKQLTNFGYMVLGLIIIIVCSLLRGGEGKESLLKIDKCSSASFVLLAFSQIATFLVSMKAYKHNKHALNNDNIAGGEQEAGGRS